jgi:hypothetical protein
VRSVAKCSNWLACFAKNLQRSVTRFSTAFKEVTCDNF